MTTEDAIFLINDNSTTVDAICVQLFSHVETYQQSREDYYMQEFKERVTSSPDEFDSEKIDEYTEAIFAEIASDSRNFIREYTNNLSDGLLDAINDKKVNKNSCKLFLTILSVMEDVLIKAFNAEDPNIN